MRALLFYLTTEDIWITAEEYSDPEYAVTIPANYRTNLASIPRILWPFIAPFELSEVAPLVHDYLYDKAGTSYKKKEADEIFRRIMKREGVPAWKRFCAYWAVRLFAGPVWRKYRNRNT